MIGDTLKRIRSIYGFKASELSQMLGISPGYLSEIENNKKQPSLEILQKCADIYEIKLSSLILLSETYDEAVAQGKGAVLVRSMMLNLIDKLSSRSEDIE